MLPTLHQLKRKLQRLQKIVAPVKVKSKKKIKRSSRIKISTNLIMLCGQTVEYTLRTNARSKSIRLAIHSGGEFTVTAPPRVTQEMVEHFIKLKGEWVVEKIGHFKNILKIPRKTKAEQKVEYARLKTDALKIATEKVHYWNTFYNFKFNDISIKNQKTRWGSCSRTGNLNFNYKIALIPDKLADYLVVHEIAHLGQFNHSAKFWALVAKTIPDYKNVRKELKGVK